MQFMHTPSTLTLMSTLRLAGYIAWVRKLPVVSGLKLVGLLIACKTYSRYFAFTCLTYLLGKLNEIHQIEIGRNCVGRFEHHVGDFCTSAI
jgi:hypothetical protein